MYILAKVLVSFKKLEFWNYFNLKKMLLKFYEHDENHEEHFFLLTCTHYILPGINLWHFLRGFTAISDSNFCSLVEKNLFTLPFSTPFRGASKAFTFYKRRQILKIEESVPTDNGNYSCLVSNRHGQVQRFFTGKYFYDTSTRYLRISIKNTVARSSVPLKLWSFSIICTSTQIETKSADILLRMIIILIELRIVQLCS